MHHFLIGFHFLVKGGFMMIPLLASALVALTISLERVYSFRTLFSSQKSVLTHIQTAISKGDLEKALQLCRTQNTPASSVLAAGLLNFDNPVEDMDLSMKNAAEEWVPLFEKHISILDTVITAAPLMGLLGTIIGMISSFQVMSIKGMNEAPAITGGVAEALIATATGLVIALGCLFAYNYFSAKTKAMIYELETLSSRLMEQRLQYHRSKKNQS